MMYIRPVNVCMHYWFMYMVVVMLYFVVFTLIVLMDMMFVVCMRMGMGKRLMIVGMYMSFPIEEKHSGKHCQSGHPIFNWWALTQKNNGKNGTYKRPGCEPCTSSCRANFSQGMDK